jgi:hypothetical protein
MVDFRKAWRAPKHSDHRRLGLSVYIKSVMDGGVSPIKLTRLLCRIYWAKCFYGWVR